MNDELLELYRREWRKKLTGKPDEEESTDITAEYTDHEEDEMLDF